MQYTRFDLFKMLLEHELVYHNNHVHNSEDYQVATEVDDVYILIYEKEGTAAHCLDQFIKMAEAFRLHYFFEVYERKDGGRIPALHIF